MFMKKNETFDEAKKRLADYEIKFGAQNEAFRSARAAKKLPANETIVPISLFELADQLSTHDRVTRKGGVIVDDF